MSLHVSRSALVRVRVTQLRDERTGPRAFRELVDELTGLLLAEALADLPLEPRRVRTPLRETEGVALARELVLVPILRAGLGMAGAASRLLPDARVVHFGAHRDERSLQPVTYYDRLSTEPLSDATVVLLDPMVATAGTAKHAIRIARASGAEDLRLVGILGAPEGTTAIERFDPEVRVTLAALDERLTGDGDPWPPGYILPGLGDAGDRLFATED